MKGQVEIDPGLIAQLIEALKVPHVAVLCGMLGVLVVCAWMFAVYAKSNKK